MENSHATQLLRDDHKKVKGLFRQFEAVDSGAKETKMGLVEETLMELEVHSTIEEEIFYPAVSEAGDEKMRGIIDQGLAAHQQVDKLIGELRDLDPEDRLFNDRFNELIENVQMHIEEEEKAILPHSEYLLDGQMHDLGLKMVARKHELLASPKYHTTQPGVTQSPGGGEQKRKSHVA